MGQNARASLVAHLNKLCQVVLGIHVGGKMSPQRNWDRQNFDQLPALAAFFGFAGQWAAGRSFWDVPSESNSAGWDSYAGKDPKFTSP